MVGHERFCSLEQGCKPCPICNGTVRFCLHSDMIDTSAEVWQQRRGLITRVIMRHRFALLCSHPRVASVLTCSIILALCGYGTCLMMKRLYTFVPCRAKSSVHTARAPATGPAGWSAGVRWSSDPVAISRRMLSG
jgi:hypothetical protein